MEAREYSCERYEKPGRSTPATRHLNDTLSKVLRRVDFFPVSCKLTCKYNG
jgi:hypothetical protein